MSFHFERAHYRLVYPMAFRPTLCQGEDRFPVIDLSEQGMRFFHPGPGRPVPEQEIHGSLELPTGEVLLVVGAVLRVELGLVSVRLVEGVPFGMMLDQQRFLHQRLAGWS